MGDTLVAANRGGIVERPANKDERRPQRQRLDHIGAPPEATVDEYRHGAGRLQQLGQHRESRDGIVELPPAMVGSNHRIGAKLTRHAHIVGRQKALEDQLAAPALADMPDVTPVQPVLAREVAYRAG